MRCCHPKLTGRIREEPKGGGKRPYVLPTSQRPSRSNPSWLRDTCATRKDPESECLSRDDLETNPITMKPETASHVAEQFSWVPLPCRSLPGRPFPIKPFALSARVSPRTIHFRVLDNSPLWGPGRGLPSCNSLITQLWKRMSCALCPDRKEFQDIQDSDEMIK